MNPNDPLSSMSTHGFPLHLSHRTGFPLVARGYRRQLRELEKATAATTATVKPIEAGSEADAGNTSAWKYLLGNIPKTIEYGDLP